MGCRECGSTRASEVDVEFTDGAEREIPLCEACRDDYRDGHFVRGIESECRAKPSPGRSTSRPFSLLSAPGTGNRRREPAS